MKPVLTRDSLIKSAKIFCEIESKANHKELIGVTDGKAVGTYIEHKFQRFLLSQYTVEIGNSAKGIDLPGVDIQTDIKVVQKRPSKNFRIGLSFISIRISQTRYGGFLRVIFYALRVYRQKQNR